MNCLICAEAMATTREDYPYTASGLPDVTLQQVEVRRCPHCGETEVALPHIAGLHLAIAAALLGKPARLHPEEMRYLRTFFGWAEAEAAPLAPWLASGEERSALRITLRESAGVWRRAR
jgi:YgiT-type zinc finger domain-containing protein